MADDHGVSCSGLGVARLVRAFGLGVLGVAILLERLVLDDLFDGDFFCVKRVFSVVVIVRANLWNLLPHLQEL